MMPDNAIANCPYCKEECTVINRVMSLWSVSCTFCGYRSDGGGSEQQAVKQHNDLCARLDRVTELEAKVKELELTLDMLANEE